jgi:hypothetical protein
MIEKEVSSIIEECAQRTRKLVQDHRADIENLSKELLVKETLDLIDIIRILGERPFPLSDSIKDYLKEIEVRKQRKIDEANTKQSNDDKNKDDNDKSDEIDKDKDLNEGDDSEGKGKPKEGKDIGDQKPKDDTEKKIQEAETIMK